MIQVACQRRMKFNGVSADLPYFPAGQFCPVGSRSRCRGRHALPQSSATEPHRTSSGFPRPPFHYLHFPRLFWR